NDGYDFIGLVGHNPGIGQLLYYLTGEVRDVPPGAVALIEFNTKTWAVTGAKTGKLVYYDTPKD
ncbi:MAG: hypothetical protein H7289_04755, partial [Mucilaginibacter sp.]|nr:hypothetical protein [Mucilaginibacter sp.]